MNKDMNAKIAINSFRVSTTSDFGDIGIIHHFSDRFLYAIQDNKAATVAGFSYVKSKKCKFLEYAADTLSL